MWSKEQLSDVVARAVISDMTTGKCSEQYQIKVSSLKVNGSFIVYLTSWLVHINHTPPEPKVSSSKVMASITQKNVQKFKMDKYKCI